MTNSIVIIFSFLFHNPFSISIRTILMRENIDNFLLTKGVFTAILFKDHDTDNHYQ